MPEKNEDIEIHLLLEAVYQKYGYDFRDYSPSHVKRRIKGLLETTAMANISSMIHRVLNDSEFLDRFLANLSINVTEMFRDPFFYRILRERILPELKQEEHLKIWHAGCATGEEVYSMAILLKEEGVYDKALLYATDFNESVLRQAKEGVYPASYVREYTTNYQKAGGKASFADYYTAKYDMAKFSDNLKRNIVFANHNLVTDSVFGEMNMIVCRNVLIYFTRELQDRVFKLFAHSLAEGGYLCLGAKESLKFSFHSRCFAVVDEQAKIYRKTPCINCDIGPVVCRADQGEEEK